MALPAHALTVDVSPESMTLGDFRVFSPGKFDAEKIVRFLVRRTNLTEAEADNLTLAELQTVAEQIAEAMRALALPKAKSAP